MRQADRRYVRQRDSIVKQGEVVTGRLRGAGTGRRRKAGMVVVLVEAMPGQSRGMQATLY